MSEQKDINEAVTLAQALETEQLLKEQYAADDERSAAAEARARRRGV